MLVWFKIYNCIYWEYSASKIPTIIWKLKSVMFRVFDWFPCRPWLVWAVIQSHIVWVKQTLEVLFTFCYPSRQREGLMKLLWALLFFLSTTNIDQWTILSHYCQGLRSSTCTLCSCQFYRHLNFSNVIGVNQFNTKSVFQIAQQIGICQLSTIFAPDSGSCQKSLCLLLDGVSFCNFLKNTPTDTIILGCFCAGQINWSIMIKLWWLSFKSHLCVWVCLV